jgi:hypothetical protein
VKRLSRALVANGVVDNSGSRIKNQHKEKDFRIEDLDKETHSVKC